MGMQTGQSLVVFGVGGVGMSAILAAKLIGAARIIAVDQNVERLDLAIDLGATHAIWAGTDVDADIRRIVPRGVDRSLNGAAPAQDRDRLLGIRPHFYSVRPKIGIQ